MYTIMCLRPRLSGIEVTEGVSAKYIEFMYLTIIDMDGRPLFTRQMEHSASYTDMDAAKQVLDRMNSEYDKPKFGIVKKSF